MRPSLRLLLVLFAFAAGRNLAAPITRDLGGGLTYVRAAVLPVDLPGQKDLRACVLDLRYGTGDESAAVAFAAWLKFHSSARTPVFILANAETATPVLEVLASSRLPAGSLTLGLPSPGFSPDVVIKTDADSERRAYNALTQTGSPEALIQENNGKSRYDEATMVREQTEIESPSVSPPTPEPLADQPRVPPPLLDRTLQRAVQVHRGLSALNLIRG